MKEIRTFEEAIKQNARSLKDLGINGTLFWAYRTSKENGNELIDFNEVIWDYDIEEIAQTLKANGITEFTISSTFSSLIETLREARNQHGRPYHSKGTLHRLEDRRARPYPCNQDDGKGGISHVERRNHRNPEERRQIQKCKILGQIF